jgi:hypothetical protein
LKLPSLATYSGRHIVYPNAGFSAECGPHFNLCTRSDFERQDPSLVHDVCNSRLFGKALALCGLTHRSGREHHADHLYEWLLNERKDEDVPMKIDRTTLDRLWRIMLRSVPLVPGPEIYDLLLTIRKSQTDFDQQVTEAVEALRNTSQLVVTLQQGIEERMAKLRQLRQEHERYSELAQIEAKKAEVLLKQVEKTLGKEQRKERWIALSMHLAVGFLFFILGVAVGDWLKDWINHLSKIIFH